jgi:multimeric flavodoxin WrbA
MKVIGVSGSPRKGNSEWMLEEMLKQLEIKGIKTELLYLRKLKIMGCDGCLACEVGGKERKGVCHIQDSMQSIYPMLTKADGFVLASPVYFEMLSGLLKNFIDRTCPIWTRLKGKKVCGIAVAEGGVGKTIDNFKSYCKVCKLQYIGSVTTLAKTPRQASKDKLVARRLKGLADKFADAL